MGKWRKLLTLEEIVDLAWPLIKGQSVPSFNSWVQEARQEIQKSPYYKRTEGSWKISTLKITSGITSSEEIVPSCEENMEEH